VLNPNIEHDLRGMVAIRVIGANGTAETVEINEAVVSADASDIEHEVQAATLFGHERRPKRVPHFIGNHRDEEGGPRKDIRKRYTKRHATNDVSVTDSGAPENVDNVNVEEPTVDMTGEREVKFVLLLSISCSDQNQKCRS
jgi:hypothetical protein